MILSEGIVKPAAKPPGSGAKDAGFRATHFNAVVDTSTAAIRSWESLGSRPSTPVPQAFDSATRVGRAACHAPPLAVARHGAMRTPPPCVLAAEALVANPSI